MTEWTPSSWRTKPALQQPDWPDAGALEETLEAIRALPPLVFAGEADTLKKSLAAAGRGEAFVLQAGDCVEAFGDYSANGIRDKLKVILQMAVVLTYGGGLPVVKIGRIAGQFAKPRSSPVERVGHEELPAFRGHAVNEAAFDATSRRPDPGRMITAYHQAASTLNLIRAFTKGGFADLRQIHTWNHEFVARSTQGRRYEATAAEIDRALQFMAACGVDLSADSHLHEVDFFTSHEALLLGFEEALTRVDSITGRWYDCSAHFLWLGDRTRDPEGAHVDFLSGVANPIGCKLGPAATPGEVVAVCERLNPGREPGRLSLIPRLGGNAVEELLPPLVQAVTNEGHEVSWICDPMHANTYFTGGRKTRHFDDILGEIKGFFGVHRELGTTAAGVHLELTAEEVTECLGGADETGDLEPRYQALCDPRLNGRQSLELAFQVGEMLQGR